MKRIILLILLTVIGIHVTAQSDGIPDNCTYTNGLYYQENSIPRYNFGAQSLELADWSSGVVVQSFATDLTALNYQIQGWSPECQYLAVAFSRTDDGGVERWDSIVWDVVNGTELVRFNDARLNPYPLTWDTNSTQLLVETRFGAYLWKMSGAQIWLTSDADFNARSFQRGSLVWDYATNQVSGQLTISPSGFATYDMSTGDLLRILTSNGTERDLTNLTDSDAVATDNGQPYACRSQRWGNASPQDTRIFYDPTSGQLQLQDRNTFDVIQVIDASLGDTLSDTRLRYSGWYNSCRFLRIEFGFSTRVLVLYDLTTGQRVLWLEGFRIYQFDVAPTNDYVVVTTRNSANLYNLVTGQVFTLDPDPISNYRYGYVISYHAIEWNASANQVRLGTTFSSSRNLTTIYQTNVFDLATGTLVEAVDRNNIPIDVDEQIALETQRTAPYGCRWSVQYQTYNQRVVIQDRSTRELITILQENLITDEFRYISKSPDCRYVAGSIWSGDSYDTYIWDLATNALVGIFEDGQFASHRVAWSPYGGYVIIHTRNGAYLWNLNTDSRIQLNTATTDVAQPLNLSSIQWDMLRGQVLAISVDDYTAVEEYDLSTGSIIATYRLSNVTRNVNYFSLDSERIIVYTVGGVRGYQPETHGFAIWNRDTGASTQFAMNFYVTPYAGNYQNSSRPLFNPTENLMLMQSSNFIYIWDLTALAGETPYLPNYTHHIESGRHLEFTGNSQITTCDLTTSREQLVRRIDEVTYYTYDVFSGELLDTTVETLSFDYWNRPC